MLRRLTAFWNLFIYGPDRGYFTINDQLSIKTKFGWQRQTTSCLIKFGIIQKENIKLSCYDNHINGSLLYDLPTRSLTKAGARLFGKYFSSIVPKRYFDRTSFIEFFNRNMFHSRFYQTLFKFDYENHERTADKILGSLDFDKAGRLHYRLFLEKCIENYGREVKLFEIINCYTGFLLLKNVADFELPGHHSKRLGIDIRPFSARLDVCSFNSLCVSIDSFASFACQNSNESIAACAQKVVPLVEVPSQIHIRLRRKRDPKDLFSIKLTQIDQRSAFIDFIRNCNLKVVD